MSRTIMVTVAAVDSDVITRSPTGMRIDGETHQARVYLATPHDSGWLLETWRKDGAEYTPDQQLELTDTDDLAAGIAHAVRTLATDKEQ